MQCKSYYKLMLMGILCLSQTLFSYGLEEKNEFNDVYDSEKYEQNSFGSYLHQPLIISHTEGNGIGYRSGYTSLETFLTLPNAEESCFVPFLDVRGHVFNDGKFASNVAVGARFVDSSVWGVNLVYDYRRNGHHDFNQLGIGLEYLGCTFDLRVNAYIPVGRHKFNFSSIGCEDGSCSDLLISEHKFFSLNGVNTELGAEVAKICDFTLYAGIGPYYFSNSDSHIFGGKSRLSLSCWDYLQLQVIGSYDNHFKSIVQGRIDLVVPFEYFQKANNCETCCADQRLRNSAFQRLERFEMIVIERKSSSFCD